MNEYEQLRLQNIARNQELLRELELDNIAQSTRKPPRNRPNGPKSKKSNAQRREKTREQPRRTSSRLAGIEADSEVAKRKAEDEAAQRFEAEKAKRARVSGPLSLTDIVIGDVSWKSEENIFTDITRNGLRVKAEEAQVSSDVGLHEKMQSLRLYEDFIPNDIKITPDRIVHLAFHPSTSKRIVVSGDKMGYLGLWEADGQKEDDDGDAVPLIHRFKIHSRTISALTFNSFAENADHIYTSSYDGSVRSLNLTSGISSEIYVPPEEEDTLLSSLEVSNDSTLYFSTLHGQFGRKDLREPSSQAEIFQLHDRKIGGFSLHPQALHLCATASLDRTMKLWDLRKMSGNGSSRAPSLVAQYESALSVSSAFWNDMGSVLTTAYDDTIRIFDFPESTKWKAGYDLGTITPNHSVRHNNQTGRWLTIFRAQWHQRPASGQQKFVVSNMERGIDIYDDKGKLLAHLRDSERITAVPAVCRFHPSQDWVVGGTASGKIALYT